MICLNSRGFGLSSSISTILGLLCGFYVLDADKLLVISTMFSLLLSDPISDSYGIYISIKENNKNLAYTKFKEIFHYKFLTQFFFFMIFVIFPLKIGYIISFILGYVVIIYDFINRFKDIELVMIESVSITILIVFIFIVNNGFKLYKKYLL